MSQIAASTGKTLKEFLRQKSVLFWTIGWPVIWVLIGSYSFAGNTPPEVVPSVRGSITTSMAVFALMIAGMANLPGNIAEDRERGVLAKLRSMPIEPWKDLVGRLCGLILLAAVAVAAVVVVGCLCGARFRITLVGLGKCLTMLAVVLLAASGIGMLIGTCVKPVHGAIMTGVGCSVVTSAISGVMAPYTALPPGLQTIARIYPISSANSSIFYLLSGSAIAGYDPWTIGQQTIAVLFAIALFAAGLVLYSTLCWKRE